MRQKGETQNLKSQRTLETVKKCKRGSQKMWGSYSYRCVQKAQKLKEIKNQNKK